MKPKYLSVSLIFLFLISLPTFTSAATPDEGLIDNFDNDASLASSPGERDGEWYDYKDAHNLSISGSVGNAYMRFDASQLGYFGIRGLDATGKKTDFSNDSALTFYLSICVQQYSHYPEPMTYYFSIYVRLIDTDGNATSFNDGAYLRPSGIGACADWRGTVRIPISWGNVDRSHIEQIQFRVSPPPNHFTYCTFDNLRAEEQATSTPTFTITPTPMNTPEDTATYTVTPTYTTTPEDTVTFTPTPVSTATPTSTLVDTATYTVTPTPIISVTPTPKQPQRVWAWIDGCFILKPGDSRDIKAISLYRRKPQPNITLRYKIMKGSGTFGGSQTTYAITGPNAEPAVASFTASDKKFDINIVRVDNLGLGGRKYLLLLVHKQSSLPWKGKGKSKPPKWYVNMPPCFESEEEATAAAAVVEGAMKVVTPIPTPVTPEPTATSSATVVPTSTRTVISTAISTTFVEAPTVLAYPNPARGQVNFAYTVSGAAKITIDIYRMTGERVASIVEHKHDGVPTLVASWQAAGVVPGVYLVRIVITATNGKVILNTKKKVALIK